MRTSLYLLAAVAGGFASLAAAQGRPLLIHESTTIASPDATITRWGAQVAIDGNRAVVRANRYVDDGQSFPYTESSVLLYGRAQPSGPWAPQGVLQEPQPIEEWADPGLAAKNGYIAMITHDGYGPRIYEFDGSGPRRMTVQDYFQGNDIEISNGRLLTNSLGCYWNGYVHENVGGAGTWRRTAVLQGRYAFCSDNAMSTSLDLHGDTAVIDNPGGEAEEGPYDPLVRVFRRGTSGWALEAEIPKLATAGYDVGVRGRDVFVSSAQVHGADVYRRTSPGVFARAGRLNGSSAVWNGGGQLEHSDEFVLQAAYDPGLDTGVVNVYRENAQGRYEHVAVLAARDLASLGGDFDISGRSVIVAPWNGAGPVRVFELPQSFATPPVLRSDFETPDPGFWTPIPGSQFAVVNENGQSFYRQSSLAGDAGAFAAASTRGDQAIEAYITPRAFDGVGRWVGLATRASNLDNYYYVTLRNGSNRLELKRRVNGQFITLAGMFLPQAVNVGSTIHVRLESIGEWHSVYINGGRYLRARDASLTSGRAGLLMYRASADFDNVIISPSHRSFIDGSFFDQQSETATFRHTGTGVWNVDSQGVYRQTSQAGDARTIAGVPTDDQIIEARVRPNLGAAGGNAWAGLLLRYVDDSNYVYISLRRNNVLSLRQLVNGQIQVIAETPLTVAVGTWYLLRVEMVAGTTRVFVNGEQRLAAGNVGPPRGELGLVTYRTAADFDDFRAWQP